MTPTFLILIVAGPISLGIFVYGIYRRIVEERARRRWRATHPRTEWTLIERCSALGFSSNNPSRSAAFLGDGTLCKHCDSTVVHFVSGSRQAPIQGEIGVYCLECGSCCCADLPVLHMEGDTLNLHKLLPHWEPKEQRLGGDYRGAPRIVFVEADAADREDAPQQRIRLF